MDKLERYPVSPTLGKDNTTMLRHRHAFMTGILAICFCFLLSVGQQLQAAEYFVSPTRGDDWANPGTSESAPLKTTHAADQKLVPGDTMTLLDGTYPILAITKSGTPGAWITIRAKNRRVPFISLAETSRLNGDADWVLNSNCVNVVNVSYVKVIGLRMQGWNPKHVSTSAGHGVYIGGSHHILIQDCRVMDCSGRGIGGIDYWFKGNTRVNGPLDFITIEGNEVSGCAFWCQYLGSGIGVCNAKDAGLGKDPSGYNLVIRNNICYGNENKIGEFTKDIKNVSTATDGNGIIIDYLDPNNHYPYATLVEGNLCFDNGGRGIHVFKSSNTTVRYNTTWHNNRNKLDYSSTHDQADLSCVYAKNVGLYDNIVVANTGAWAASVGLADAFNVTLSNNLVFGPRSRSRNSTITAETGTLTADPLFVNPSADPTVANFRLRPASPAITAPNATPAPATDLDGVARPQGKGSGIGAYAPAAGRD